MSEKKEWFELSEHEKLYTPSRELQGSVDYLLDLATVWRDFAQLAFCVVIFGGMFFMLRATWPIFMDIFTASDSIFRPSAWRKNNSVDPNKVRESPNYGGRKR